MVRPEVIRKRLNKADEYLRILKDLQRLTYDEFSGNPVYYGSTERFLQLAIETLTDMGNHVIAELELGIVNSYRDIPILLAEAGHIDHDIRDKWISMIGFRNILIHDYLEIDRKIVYTILQDHLADLKAIQNLFAPFL